MSTQERKAKQRRIALVSICPVQGVECEYHDGVAQRKEEMEWNVAEHFHSFGVRVLAARIRAQFGDAVDVVVFDEIKPDLESLAEKIDEFQPDILGLSVFVWSFFDLINLSRQIKAMRDCLVVLGGPSARQSMFQLPAFTDALNHVDVLVEGEGEQVICDLVGLETLDRENLRLVPGIMISENGQWVSSDKRMEVFDLEKIVSPYDYGLMPEGIPGYLETFRGCPFSCLFCEWGTSSAFVRALPTAAIESQLLSLKNHSSSFVMSLDAGINLNPKAFRRLVEADERVDALKDLAIIFEVYPSKMTDEVYGLIERCKGGYAGVGLQSFDPEVCTVHNRHFDEEKFRSVVYKLASLPGEFDVEIQIIMGLPGDNPQSFRETVLKALSFPVQVRAFHCLVLPDALLDRSPPDFAMNFDPHTMRMIDCLGWTHEDIQGTTRWMNELARERNGMGGDGWWAIPGDTETRDRLRQKNEDNGVRH